jgi:hypothetical protein
VVWEDDFAAWRHNKEWQCALRQKEKKFLFFRYEDCIRCILGSYWWGGADDDRIGSQDAPA